VQIADQMNIAPSTVEVHRRNIMRKLNLHSVAELTRYVLSRSAPAD
jgi:two-component system NarL family response regulator